MGFGGWHEDSVDSRDGTPGSGCVDGKCWRCRADWRARNSVRVRGSWAQAWKIGPALERVQAV